MVCLDTMVVLWGIQSYADEGQKGMISRTKSYLKALSEKGESVMIPTPVVSECLVGLSEDQMNAQRALIEGRFFIPAFDLSAAVEAARLLSNKHAFDLARSKGAKREQLKVDAQIAAIAIVNGAEKIISHDAHMKTVAQNRIPVEEVPDIPEQLDLLGEDV